MHGTTSNILKDILQLLPLDTYDPYPIRVMDRVQSDKDKAFEVPAYKSIAEASNLLPSDLLYVERFEFYEQAKKTFVVIQTDDRSAYANCIVSKGVVFK